MSQGVLPRAARRYCDSRRGQIRKLRSSISGPMSTTKSWFIGGYGSDCTTTNGSLYARRSRAASRNVFQLTPSERFTESNRRSEVALRRVRGAGDLKVQCQPANVWPRPDFVVAPLVHGSVSAARRCREGCRETLFSAAIEAGSKTRRGAARDAQDEDNETSESWPRDLTEMTPPRSARVIAGLDCMCANVSRRCRRSEGRSLK